MLVDNGSLEPAATLNLRAIAQRLADAVGQEVTPVSLLHSSTIAPVKLGGQAAEILEPALERRLRNGTTRFLVVPLFFGPSSAVTDYLPRRLHALREKFPDMQVQIAPPLVDVSAADDDRMAAILEERVQDAVKRAGSSVAPHARPAVVLVDHGSPTREVVAVRDHLARQLERRLGASARCVVAASMERRAGPEYAFAEPLLEHIFDRDELSAGLVIVAMLFLSPGRHAGPTGDVAQIIASARMRHPRLQVAMTDLVGSHPGLIPILTDRVRAGLLAPPV